MSFATMHEYYREQDVLPTHGRFTCQQDLDTHEKHRRELFTQKLCLPPRVFRGTRLLEFGPDSGENALVFARWGARCTLVEPNPKAHPVITAYFDRFGLADQLEALDPRDLKAYAEAPPPEHRYDMIVAEGFIYTVQPTSLWAGLFGRILAEDGFVILFYCDPFGNFFELFKKVIYSRVRELTGWSSLEAARKLFLTKWNSIPHKRGMESWVMDVLENPFVRLSHFLEPQTLCAEMLEAGLSLYSSWPPYRDGLANEWFKRSHPPEVRLRDQNRFIGQSRISHLFGRKHFLRDPDPQLETRLLELLRLTDGLVDRFEPDGAGRCSSLLEMLARTLKSNAVIADPADTEAAVAAVESTRELLRLLAESKTAAVVDFCNRDPGFLGTWGMPSHFAIFTKEPSPIAAGPRAPAPLTPHT